MLEFTLQAGPYIVQTSASLTAFEAGQLLVLVCALDYQVDPALCIAQPKSVKASKLANQNAHWIF
jgi:hypothetical protein